MIENTATEIIDARTNLQSPVALYLASVGLGSRRALFQSVRVVTEVLCGPSADPARVDWRHVGYEHGVFLRARLQQLDYSPNSCNRHLAAFKGVARQAFLVGLLSSDTWVRINEIHGVPGTRLSAGRALGAVELDQLAEACRADVHPNRGLRDACVLALLYGGGLRREELFGLDHDDLEPELVAITVLGKGDRERRVPLPPGTRRAVSAWLGVRGTSSGPLVVNIGRRDTLTEVPIRPSGIAKILERVSAEAQIRRCSPHDLRRTYIGDLLDSGADLSITQRLAGHASPLTTARYDRRPDRVAQVAADRLRVPFG